MSTTPYTDKAIQRSTMHWAIENHRWSDLSIIISNVLQKKKGNPNLRDKYGMTPLHLAAWNETTAAP